MIIFEQMSRINAKTGLAFRIGADCQAKIEKSRSSLTAEHAVVLWLYREPGPALSSVAFLVTKLRHFHNEAAAISENDAQNAVAG